jgi:hypothetical protein
VLASSHVRALRLQPVGIFILILGWPDIWAGHGRRVGFWRGRALVDEEIATIIICPGALMLFYRAALALSSQTLAYGAGVIRRHRRQIGSRWRELSSGRQALLVLVYLRKGETFADLAAGFGVGTATAWRYVTEAVALLAAQSPKLRRALAEAGKAGYAYVVIDGRLIPIDRLAADRPFYSGKHRRHGMNLQVIATLRQRHRVGVRAVARRRARPDHRPDLGHRAQAPLLPWRAGQLAKDPRSSGPRDRKTKNAQWDDGEVL